MNDNTKNKLFLSLKSKKFDNLNIRTSVEKTENCMLNNRCPYYKKYIKFKNQILAFISSQEKLKLVNQSLHMAIAEKNKMYKEVKDENNYLKGIIFNLTGISFTDFSYLGNKLNNIDNNQEYLEISPRLNTTFTKRNNILRTETGKNNKKFYDKIKFDFIETKDKYKNSNFNDYLRNTKNQTRNNKFEKILKISTGQKSTSSNNRYTADKDDNNNNKEIPKKIESRKSQIKLGSSLRKPINSFNPNDYYEIINNYTKKQKFQSLTREINSSYISLDVDLMEILNNNTSLKKLEYLSKKRRKFYKNMQNRNK